LPKDQSVDVVAQRGMMFGLVDVLRRFKGFGSEVERLFVAFRIGFLVRQGNVIGVSLVLTGQKLPLQHVE
jgi:hypothetical protein